MTMGERSGSRYPFTASQWQELEHQALIFKCMAIGIPIPHDLILPIKSFYLDYTSTSAATLFPHQSSIGWQMWFGKKGEDPEPGRCRRTDGKKWRCSREAYPESKYCERHMHRGKNRSRKRVEAPTATTSTTAGAAATATSPNPCLYTRLPMAAASEAHVYSLCSASRDTVTGFPPPRSSPHFNLHTASSSADRDSRYNNVWKERVDRYTFSEATIARRDEPRRLTPPGMDSLGAPRGRSCSSLQHNGGCFTATVLPTEERRNKSQHCFVLQGDDFDVGRSTKAAAEEPQKPLPPSKSKNLWMDQQEGPGREVLPRTHLSISIPMAHQDFRSRDGSVITGLISTAPILHDSSSQLSLDGFYSVVQVTELPGWGFHLSTSQRSGRCLARTMKTVGREQRSR